LIINGSHISHLLESIGLDYFDLLIYYSPTAHFNDQKKMETNWRTLIAEIGVSNYYKKHLDRLLVLCTNNGLQFPFANQIMVNPYVFPDLMRLIQ